MATDKHVSETPATRFLKRHGVNFTEHIYDYVQHGGATHAAQSLGLPPDQVAKTLIMEDEHARPLIIIMPGNVEVSTKQLARQINAKRVTPCKPEVAQKHTAYQVGGTSPFATRKRMPVWIEADLLEHEVIYINGGRRGYLIGLAPRCIADLLNAKAVTVGLPKH